MNETKQTEASSGVQPLTFSKPPGLQITSSPKDDAIQWPRSSRAKPASVNATYEAWRADPTPENGAKLLDEVKPYITQAVTRHTGSANSVNMGKAKVLLMKSLPRYDGRASMQTFIDRQLMPMQRWSAKNRAGVKVPTSFAHEARHLQQVESDFEFENGRLPSRAELADASGMSLARIKKVTSMKLPSIAEREYATEEGSVAASDSAVEGDSLAWQRTVYYSLNPVNQFIMEHTTGFNGASELSNREIAKRLKISPSAVSQRKTYIQNLIDQE